MKNIDPGRVLVVGIGVFLIISLVQRGHISSESLIYFGLLIPSVILHEISHGWLANAFGDDTAKRAGRLSLNPIKHIDPFGTVILPAMLVLLGAPAFGYAKPVPVNTARMSRNKAMFTALIGPFTNILIAIVAAIALHFTLEVNSFTYGTYVTPVGPEWISTSLLQLGLVNVVLAVFNLLPIPPLDGSSVVERFLPDRYLMGYLKFRQYAIFLLLILMLMGSGVIGQIFEPFQRLWLELVLL